MHPHRRAAVTFGLPCFGAILLLAQMLLSASPSRATVDEIISLPFVNPPFGLVQQPPLNSDFTPIRWNLAAYPEGRIPFVIDAGSTPNGGVGASALTAAEVRAAFRASFDTWEAVPSSAVAFALDEPANPPQRAGLDGVNLLTFGDTEIVGPGTLGATLIFALDRSGEIDVGPFVASVAFVNEIIEADTALNPNIDFATDGNVSSFDLQSVVTHELGHALGRDHTGLMHATMFGTGTRGNMSPRSLSQDDVAGISNIYPAGGALSGAVGSIGGSVRRSGAAVFGAHVVALDAQGLPQVSAISFPDGNFRLVGLLPGAYTLYVEPFDGPSVASEYDLGVLFNFSAAFSTSIAPETFTVRGGEEVENVRLTVSGDGALNITGIAMVDALTFLPIEPAGLALAPGDITTIQLTGTGLQQGVQVSVSGSDVDVVGELAFFGRNPSDGASNSSVEVTLEVAPDAALGPRTIFVESNGRRAALSGGVVIDNQVGASQVVNEPVRPLTPGEELTGSIRFANEQDRYSFQGRAGQFATIAMLAGATSSLDSFLVLSGPDGSALDSNDDAVGLSAVLQEVRLPVDGEYRVIGTGFAGSTGEYTISLLLDDAPQGFSQPRGALLAGDTVDGSIAEAGALEVWTFEAGSDEVVTIRVSSRGSLDPFVELFDSTFELLASDDDSGPEVDALLEGVRLATGGRHFIRVRGLLSTTGAYTLTLEPETPQPGSGMNDPFALRVRVNAASYRAGDPFVATLTTSGAASSEVDLYLLFILPDGSIAYTVPESSGRFSAEEGPLTRRATLSPAPVELLSLTLPAVPVGSYSVIAAFVSAGVPPALTTIQALDVAFFQIEGLPRK